MVLYLVYANLDDMIEDYGPMVLDSVWLSRELAAAYVDTNQIFPGDWEIREMQTKD